MYDIDLVVVRIREVFQLYNVAPHSLENFDVPASVILNLRTDSVRMLPLGFIAWLSVHFNVPFEFLLGNVDVSLSDEVTDIRDLSRFKSGVYTSVVSNINNTVYDRVRLMKGTCYPSLNSLAKDLAYAPSTLSNALSSSKSPLRLELAYPLAERFNTSISWLCGVGGTFDADARMRTFAPLASDNSAYVGYHRHADIEQSRNRVFHLISGSATIAVPDALFSIPTYEMRKLVGSMSMFRTVDLATLYALSVAYAVDLDWLCGATVPLLSASRHWRVSFEKVTELCVSRYAQFMQGCRDVNLRSLWCEMIVDSRNPAYIPIELAFIFSTKAGLFVSQLLRVSKERSSA